MSVGQEIIGNAVLAIVGTGCLLLAAFLWVLEQGAIFLTIVDSLPRQATGARPLFQFLTAINSQLGLLNFGARVLVLGGNLLLLWGLYRHSHCSRWYNDVYEVIEKRQEINRFRRRRYLT